MIIIKIGAGIVIGVILIAGFIDWYGNMRETRGYNRGELDGFICGHKAGMKKGFERGVLNSRGKV